MKPQILLFFLLLMGYFCKSTGSGLYSKKSRLLVEILTILNGCWPRPRHRTPLKIPTHKDRQSLSELDQFTQSLNSQLLGQVSRSLFTEQFGDAGIKPGTYSFGSLAVDIYPSNEGLVINILDTNTGEQTQIVVPN